MSIPKKLHYIWISGDEKPHPIKKCIKSFDKLRREGFEVVEWNKSNLDLGYNEYTKKHYAARNWAFLSDFYRLYLLYEHGGVYLDADIFVKKNFYEIIKTYSLSLCFIFDHMLSGELIAAVKGHDIIRALLEFYNQTDVYKVPNEVYTEYFLNNFDSFRLTNEFQQPREDIAIFPRQYFSSPSFSKNSYAVHFGEASWRGNSRAKKALLSAVKSNMLTYALYNKFYVQPASAKISPYREIYLEHTRK